MKINDSFLGKEWTKIREQISKMKQVPLAQKILFYKVFLRPLLIFNWVEGCANDLKAIEMKVLKQIFETGREDQVYKQYSDVDVSCYLKLQESIWSPWNTLHPKILKSMHRTTKDSDNSCPYFLRAFRPTIRQRRRCNHRRWTRARCQRSRFPRQSNLQPDTSYETLDSQSYMDSVMETTLRFKRNIRLLSPVSETSTINQMGLRRSVRLANKNRKTR